MIENSEYLLDFIQDAKPSNQGVNGRTWLRTTDGELFAWDNTNTRWVSMNQQHLDFTSLDDFTGVGASDKVVSKIHADLSITGTDNTLRPYQSLVIQQLAINAANTPNSAASLDVLIDSSITHTLPWDGVINYAVEDGLNIVVDGEAEGTSEELAFQWESGTPAPAAGQRFRGTAWYKWIVPGD